MLNFDPNKKKAPYITSPRSLESCRRQGINPQELLFLPFPEFRKLPNSKGLEVNAAKLKFQHAEERRKEKIRVLVEVINLRIYILFKFLYINNIYYG